MTTCLSPPGPLLPTGWFLDHSVHQSPGSFLSHTMAFNFLHLLHYSRNNNMKKMLWRMSLVSITPSVYPKE